MNFSTEKIFLTAILCILFQSVRAEDTTPEDFKFSNDTERDKLLSFFDAIIEECMDEYDDGEVIDYWQECEEKNAPIVNLARKVKEAVLKYGKKMDTDCATTIQITTLAHGWRKRSHKREQVPSSGAKKTECDHDRQVIYSSVKEMYELTTSLVPNRHTVDEIYIGQC